MTQQDVADAMGGVFQQQVERWEKRLVKDLKVETVVSFAKAFNLPLLALIDPDSYDDTDVALMRITKRLPRAEKARLLAIAAAFEVPIKVA